MNRYSRWLVDETHVSDRMRLKLVANSLISSTKIGTVQACYFLLNLPTVKLSRTVENFNPIWGRLNGGWGWLRGRGRGG